MRRRRGLATRPFAPAGDAAGIEPQVQELEGHAAARGPTDHDPAPHGGGLSHNV